MITTTLAYFPSPSQGVWHLTVPFLGTIPLRAYAMFIILGIIAALVIGDRRWAARGGERGVIYDIALWAVPFGLAGGRLYHVMTDWKTYFGPDGAGPVAALRIWDGGLGIWGAVALGGVGAWIACRRRGIPLPAFGDAVAPGIVLAQAIGRLGNYFNQELYGRETTVPWGMEIFYRRDPSGIVDVHSLSGVSTGQVAAVVHPTFLYELLWNLLVFVVLILIDRKFKIGHGRLFALYVALYCVGRFGVELLRDDVATHIDGIRINSFTATFVFLGAVVYIILAKKGREDPQTLAGHEEFDEDFDEDNVPELAQELVAAAAGTGIVAAVTVAGREDVEYESDAITEVADELEAADEFEPLDESDGDAETGDVDESTDEAEAESEATDDVDPVATEVVAESSDDAEVESDAESDAEDESIVEAEVASAGVEIESDADAEAEDDLIDEDHDPVDEDDLEGLFDGGVTSAPVSEQEESLETADEDAELEEPSEVVSEAARADSSDMVIVYASDPVDDGIVFVQSEDDAAEAASPTVVYAADGEPVEIVEAESVDLTTDDAEAAEQEATVDAGQTDPDDSADVGAESETDVADAASEAAESVAEGADTPAAEADTTEAVRGSRLGRFFRRN